MVKRGPNLGAVPTLDWRTWGQETVLTIPEGESESNVVQLVNISHPHPESWRFLLSGQWLTAPGIFGLTLQFGCLIGNGLTRMSLQSPAQSVSDNESFAYFRWNTNVNPFRWTTKVRVPDVNDFFTPTTPGYAPSFAEVIVGQTIAISAKAFYGAPAPVGGMLVRAAASFAPNVFGDNRKAFKDLDGGWHPAIVPEETGFSDNDYEDDYEDQEGPY